MNEYIVTIVDKSNCTNITVLCRAKSIQQVKTVIDKSGKYDSTDILSIQKVTHL